MRFLKRKERGFTLIELLVVIAIIGLLASVVLASLDSARAKARNAARISDITQYQIALELYLDAYGEYPDANGWACLGDYSDNDCFNGIGEEPLFNAAIAEFIPGLPAIEHPVGNEEGYMYRDQDNQQGYRIYYNLEGSDQNCGPGLFYTDGSGDNSDCRICGGTWTGHSNCGP